MPKLRAIITVEYDVDLDEYGVGSIRDAVSLDQQNIQDDAAGFLMAVPTQFVHVKVESL